MNFSRWLQRLLESKGWTQAQAARALGVSQSQISSLLSGQSPTLSTVERLAAHLHCSPADVLGEVYGIAKLGGSVVPLDAAIVCLESLPPKQRIAICAKILTEAVEEDEEYQKTD